MQPDSPAGTLRGHLSGETSYVDDQLPRQGTLEAHVVTASYARATVTGADAAAALEVPGVRRVILADDIPGTNSVAPGADDEELIASGGVEFFGQVVALVVGDSEAACRAGARALKVGLQPLPPVIGIEEAIAVQSFHAAQRTLARGDVDGAFEGAPSRLRGSLFCGGQDHFYLEPQVALAEPDGRGGLRIECACEDLSGVQAQVARVLGCAMHRIEVGCPRIGGGFAGKQTQPARPAALAALAAHLAGRPVRLRLTRREDMLLSGKRHPVFAEFSVGHDEGGRLLAAEVFLYLDGGCSVEHSETVLDNLLLHLDNCYFLPALRAAGRVCKTHTVSNTLCVGAGAPQAAAIAEEMIAAVARSAGVPAEIVRQRNLYRDDPDTPDAHLTHFGQQIPAARLQQVWRRAIREAEFPARRKGVQLWNSKSRHLRRGLAVVPVKFGTGSLDSTRGQASCLLQAFTDGSLRVGFGGVDTGQGIGAAAAGAVAAHLGIEPRLVRATGGETALAPNSPVGSGIEADLAAEAARDACDQLKARLKVLAAQTLQARGASVAVLDDVEFAGGEAFSAESPDVRVTFGELVEAAYRSRVSLMATGFARSHPVKFDRASGRGEPFRDFLFGAAVAEVQVDCLTGESEILRADLVVDAGAVGDAVDATSAVRGAFLQGVGWLTTEELLWGADGELLTVTPDTYKVPTLCDAPLDFRVTLASEVGDGSPPSRPKDPTACAFMLAVSVREAIRDAVLAAEPADAGGDTHLPSPATPEAVYQMIERRRSTGGRPAIPREDSR